MNKKSIFLIFFVFLIKTLYILFSQSIFLNLNVLQILFLENIISFFLLIIFYSVFATNSSLLFLLLTPFFFIPFRWAQKSILIILLCLFYHIKNNKPIKVIIFLLISSLVLFVLFSNNSLTLFYEQLEVVNGINELRGLNQITLGPTLARLLSNKLNLTITIYKYFLLSLSPTFWLSNHTNITHLSPFSVLSILPLIFFFITKPSRLDKNMIVYLLILTFFLGLLGPLPNSSAFTPLIFPLFYLAYTGFTYMPKYLKNTYLVFSLIFNLSSLLFFL